MLDALIRLAVRHRLAVVAGAALVLVLSLLGLRRQAIDIFPELNRPTVTIFTEAGSLAPEEVEARVNLPIERAVTGAPGVERVRSSAGIGLSLVHVEFAWSADSRAARLAVAERLQEARGGLPEGVVPTLAPASSLMGQILVLGLVSPSGQVDPGELRDVAEWELRPRLLAVPGVSKVTVVGGHRRQWQVLADPERLRASGVGLAELEAALEGAGLDAAGGFQSSGPSERLVRLLARARGAEDLRGLVVRAEPGRPPLLLGDVAEVRLGLGRGFFEARRGWGLADRSPIFVVGLPRSGSTLVEQILASHSQVEGTAELPYMPMLLREALGDEGGAPRGAAAGVMADGTGGADDEGGFAVRLAALGEDRLRAIGERYLAAAAVHRVTDRPFFIDKALNNFFNVGVIRLMLPGARIVDTRRHPLSCGFSNFKQLFVRGQLFSYSLRDIGLYYRDYVSLMAHWDAVLPGVVHRVVYERMVQDTEGEVRRLLTHCALPFEEGCLAFHRNERAVRTVSSEQVRRPIYTEGMDHWRNFEPWLGELKDALGSVLQHYPEAPPELR